MCTDSFALQELLSETEKLMLAKRLALIAMLVEERSYYRIKHTLGISTSTIKRFHHLIDRNGYLRIRKLLAVRQQKEDLMEFLEKLSRAGMPPVVR